MPRVTFTEGLPKLSFINQSDLSFTNILEEKNGCEKQTWGSNSISHEDNR